MPHLREHEDRSVFADECRAVLAVPAEPDGALHVPLHREIDLVFYESAPLELEHAELHHRLWTADVRDRRPRVELQISQQIRHDADVPLPRGIASVDCDENFDVFLLGPFLEFHAEQQIERTAGTVQNDDPAEAVTLAEQRMEERTERRQTKPSCHNAYIFADRGLGRPER